MNQDGAQDAKDLQTGDEVLVQARLPKDEPGTPPFAARKIVDETHPADDATEAPQAPAGS